VIAVDSSIAVPALLSWHEFHDVARVATVGAAIPAHAMLETYSVLTRMAGRLAPEHALELLEGRFREDVVLVPTQALALSLVRRSAEAGLYGGAVYDALIGWTAAEHSRRLVTLDARAARNYSAADIQVELLGAS